MAMSFKTMRWALAPLIGLSFLVAPAGTAFGSQGVAVDGGCPEAGGYVFFSYGDNPTGLAWDAREGSIDGLLCVTVLNDNAGFRNFIDNLVQGP